MNRREIIEIDEEKCTGCGQCIINCAEGALEIVDGKAKLVSDVYCDGLGACLGDCPEDALKVVVREAVEFDEAAVEIHLARSEAEKTSAQPETLACGCPGSVVRQLETSPVNRSDAAAPVSALRNWPVQLHLVPTKAPFYDNAELIIAADCTGFALTNLHQKYLADKNLIIACPKLDDAGLYEAKLAEIFKSNDITGIQVLYMTVPCCSGLIYLLEQALAKSGKNIPLEVHKIDFDGSEIEEGQKLAVL
ncbi:MAG: 4Fe-4S binding protein [Deltaproteobacteria bacterium]|nr:4Fe-4S binding protein [Deltaproteobacteria bacterium]